MAGWGQTLVSVLLVLCVTWVASPVTLRAQEAPADTPQLPGSPVPINSPPGNSSGLIAEPGAVSPKTKAAPVPAVVGPHPSQLLDAGVLPGQAEATAGRAAQESLLKLGESVQTIAKNSPSSLARSISSWSSAG
jgi:hypothetical protein